MATTSLSFAMLSHPGQVRQRNEDACAADLDHGVFVVCDGVGGAAGGEVASQLAAKSFIAQIVQHRQPGSGTENGLEAGFEAGISDGVEHANHAVHTRALSSAKLYGMATTMVAMLVDLSAPQAHPEGVAAAGTVWVANIGDSRCYRLREGRFEQLTRDHSIVEEQVRAGAISREQAEMSPIRNVITRAIGSEPIVEPDIQSLPARHGDLYLLTSDGLMRELRDGEIAALLGSASLPAESSGNAELEALCRKLIDEANRRGGGDNITCLLVYVH